MNFVFDPLRSTSLPAVGFFTYLPSFENESQSSSKGDDVVLDGAAYRSTSKSENASIEAPTVIFGAHDLALIKSGT